MGKELDLLEEKTFANFAKKVQTHREEVLKQISSCSTLLIGYGASGRANTFLNYCGFDEKMMKCIIDDSSIRQHTWTPGTNIPILSLDEASKIVSVDSTITIFILAWSYKNEILKRIKQSGYFKNCKFMVAFPKIEFFET